MLSPEYKVSSKIQLNWEFAVQFDKFLVPSIPQYGIEDSREIVKGYDPNISSFRAMYQSFYDSPQGLSGELKEINFKTGTELRANYDNKIYLALRYGISREASYIENNFANTLGIGIGLYGFSLDFKRLKPNLTSNPNKNFAFSLAYRMPLKGSAFRF